MKAAPLLAVIVAAMLFGWFAPDLTREPSAPPEQPAETAEPARLGVVRKDQWNAGEVVLLRSADGHFYADVTVDSVAMQMLVDTGASIVALTGEDAEAIGIYWEPGQVRPVARGANGTVYGVPVNLDLVQLGQLEARNVQAVVVPDGLGISLLGQSFLGRIERVEIEPEQMVLGG